jgi:hypothetical protein
MNFLRAAWGAERHDVQEVAALASRKLVAVVRRSITRLLRLLRSRERDSIVS